MRLDGLAVERDDHWIEFTEIEPEDAGIGSVHEPQPDPLIRPRNQWCRRLSVDSDRVADPACHHRVVPTAEPSTYLPLVIEPPVVEHPDEVAIDLRRICLFDNERSVEAATDLLEAALMGMVPESARILRRKGISEPFAGLHGGLGEVGNAIHRVGNTNAVPMDGCFLIQSVFQQDLEGLSLPKPESRTRYRAIVTPHRYLRGFADEWRAGRSGFEDAAAGGCAGTHRRSTSGSQNGGQSAANGQSTGTGEDRAARQS